MAKKETIGEIAVGIGLDLSMLDMELEEADQTLKSAISKINANTKRIKLETEIDTAKLTAAGSAVDQLKAKERGLTREIEEQNKAVKLLRANQQYAEKTYGADNWKTRQATNEYLKQVAHVEKLNARLRETQQSLARINGAAAKNTSVFGGLGTRFSGGLSGATAAATAFAGSLAAVYAATLTLRQGLEWVSEGVDKNAQVFDFANQYGATFDDMRDMLGIFESAKVEGRDVFKALAKTLEETSDPANKTAQALARFGVSLYNADGEAKSTRETLYALADGFRKAEAAGRQMEFIQALPRNMRQYVDLLQKFPVYLQESQKVTRAIIDPEAAATVGDDLRTLDVQLSQFKQQIAGVLLPVALEYVPRMTAAFGDLMKAVEANKAPLQAFAEILAAIVGVLPRAAAGIGELAAEIQNFGNGEIAGNPLGDYFGDSSIGDAIKGIDKASKSLADFRKEQDAAAEKKKPIIGEEADFSAVENYEKEVKKLGKTLQDELYKATHNDLENTLHDIELTAEKRKKAIVDAAKAAKREVPQETLDLIDTAAEQRKAKVLADFEQQTAAQVTGIWQTALEKRLADIEREKRAWIQKGIDEVQATRAAEEQKRRAVQDAAQQMFTSQRKLLEAYRKARQQQDTGIELIKGVEAQGGGGVIGALQEVLREQMGIKAGDRTTVEEIQGFTAALEQAKRTLIPIGEGQYTGPEVMRGLQAAPAWTQDFTSAINSAFAPLANGEITLGADGIESRLDRTNDELRAIREGQRGAELQAPVVNVSVVIESAVTQDSAAMRQLADTVADHITPVVENAIGNTWNSYSR